MAKVSFTKGDTKKINTKFSKDKSEDTLTINLSDDEIDRRYPLSYDELVKILRKRYTNIL